MHTPVIIALDFPTKAEAMALVRALGEEATFYKVGLQLLTEEGPEVIRELVAQGKRVFLDLKPTKFELCCWCNPSGRQARHLHGHGTRPVVPLCFARLSPQRRRSQS